MWNDLRSALTRLRAAPGFTAVAIVTLALPIAVNTAIFSIADAVLFRPLPYADPERVFVLQMHNLKTGTRSGGVPYEYVQALEHHRGVEAIALRSPPMMLTHQGGGEAEFLETYVVDPNYFHVLGVRPALGRLFIADDAAIPLRSVMISHQSWRQRFGGDERIVGRSVAFGTTTRTIVGVLPPGFMFPSAIVRFMYSSTGRPEFVTVALPPPPGAAPRAPNALVRGGFAIDPVVRLRAGVTREQAQAELDVLAATPIRNGRPGNPVLEEPRALLFPTGQPVMALLLGAAALVLFIGCANLANMLLTRARQREREIGVRTALGATRLRIVRPIVFETLIIGSTSAVVALIGASLGFTALLRQVPSAAYGTALVGIDVRVGVFALGLGLLAGVIFAVVPAWRSAGLDVQPLLQHSRATRQHRTFGHPMIIVQVALAIVLVCGALVAGRALVSVLRVPLGFSPEDVLTLNVTPNVKDALAHQEFFVRAIRTLSSRPEVLSAGAGASIPLDTFGVETTRESPDHPPAAVIPIFPGYVETLQIRVLRGRLPDWQDLGTGASAVSESAAHALFPDRDSLGATVTTAGGRQLLVVGIVSDVLRSVGQMAPPPIYASPPENFGNRLTLLVRVRHRHPTTLATLRHEVGLMAPGQPVITSWWTDTIEEMAAYRNPRLQALVLGSFGVLALGLTSLGVFALVTFLVTRRTREMGVRVALGAPPRSLVVLIVRQVATPVVVGVILGSVGTLWLRRLAEAQLASLDSRDPLTFAAAIAAVSVAAAVAAYVPARRATDVDPVVVLRAE